MIVMGFKKTPLTIAVLLTVGIVLAIATAGFLVTQQFPPSDSNSVNSIDNGNNSIGTIDSGNNSVSPIDSGNQSVRTIVGGGGGATDDGSEVSTINVGLYTDPAATNVCSNIEWGTISPGSNVTQTIYVKNTGNTPETLRLTTSGWNPSNATSTLTLTWDKQGSTLPAGSIVQATLTLTVASNTGTLSTFSFNIIISGEA
jgi:hypothetical protein